VKGERRKNKLLDFFIPSYCCPINFYPAYVLNSSVFKNKFLNPPSLQEEECKFLKLKKAVPL